MSTATANQPDNVLASRYSAEAHADSTINIPQSRYIRYTAPHDRDSALGGRLIEETRRKILVVRSRIIQRGGGVGVSALR